MKGSSVSAMESNNDVLQSDQKTEKPQKPPFRRAQDDTKPPLHDPILRSDPIETEEAVLRLPPLPSVKSGFQSR
ncbi:hypothetical protein HS088_TW23G00229 [Tripterygium wilfordii]|uniref:Uncharacterized protein n=1 Tax=Tripterygium wilfordii TaxID=458696 RepID=A0A7J7BVD5_TRIWF|nr:uncharacterized protein LOC119993867 [Tripterygium wilfordii]KAF5725506.1 hypothetical protein HS088_TW23G00229 [Tripterygium wilfordii]